MKAQISKESGKGYIAEQQLALISKLHGAGKVLSESEILKSKKKSLSAIASVFYMLLFCLTLVSCSKDKEETPQPAGGKITGTVNAVAGQNVAGTYIMACYNNDCEDDKTKYVQLTQNQPNAPFEIAELTEGKYSIIAWKDNNANSELDAGDGLGFVSSNGKDPDMISPPKENVLLQMTTMSGSGGDTPIGSNTISGTVSVPAGQSVAGTIVIACQWNGTECVEQNSEAAQVQANGSYVVSGLQVAYSYFIIAWKDLNNNGSIDDGDLYGLHIKDGSIGSVIAPSQDINVVMARTSTEGSPGGGGSGSGSVPSNLVGDWIRGTAGAVDFYNPSTGSWAAPTGTGMYLQLFADGSFEFSTVAQVTNYNCTTQVTTFYRGKAIFNGNQLTLEPSYTRQKYNSNCYSQYNSDKVVPNSPLPFTWRLGTGSDGKPELVLIWPPEGIESAFRRP